MKHLSASSLVLFVVLGALSCGKEEDPMLKLIQGRWEIKEAYRNDQATESLADLYFQFEKDGRMETNLPVSETPAASAYSLKRGVITQTQGALEIEYQIETVTDTSLVLNTTLQNFPFRFVFSKPVDMQ